MVGACLDASSAIVACDGEHAAEAFSQSSECTHDALLEYLGGTPGLDVLRSNLEHESLVLNGEPLCIVRVPPDSLHSNRDVLLSRAGDVWRRCHDQLSREVACSEPHVSETIFEQRTSREVLACADRANAYLGTTFDRHADDLELLRDGKRCYLKARGENLLLESLRRLGSGALPVEAVLD